MVCILLVSTVAVLLLARVKAHEDSNCSFPVPSIRWSSPVPVRISDGLFETLQGNVWEVMQLSLLQDSD